MSVRDMTYYIFIFHVSLSEIPSITSRLEKTERDSERWLWRGKEEMSPNPMSTLSPFCKDPWLQRGYAKQWKEIFVFHNIDQVLTTPRHQVTGPHYISLESCHEVRWACESPKEMGSHFALVSWHPGCFNTWPKHSSCFIPCTFTHSSQTCWSWPLILLEHGLPCHAIQ